MTDNEQDTQPVAERVTVSLIPKVSRELEQLRTGTGLSRTDLVNRAVTLYAFVQAELDAGRKLALRDPDGTTQIVVLT